LVTFSRSDFAFDPERNLYVCPGGKEPTAEFLFPFRDRDLLNIDRWEMKKEDWKSL
jgi:hypothetical protein